MDTLRELAVMVFVAFLRRKFEAEEHADDSSSAMEAVHWRAQLVGDVGERVAEVMVARGLVSDCTAVSIRLLSLLPLQTLPLPKMLGDLAAVGDLVATAHLWPPTLTHIDLTGAREAGAFLAGLATSQAAKSITHLTLSRCADIIERDLVHLHSIPSLKQLNLGNTEEVALLTCGPILAHSCPQLESLTMSADEYRCRNNPDATPFLDFLSSTWPPTDNDNNNTNIDGKNAEKGPPLPLLTSLVMIGTIVSPAAFRRFLAQRPNVDRFTELVVCEPSDRSDSIAPLSSNKTNKLAADILKACPRVTSLWGGTFTTLRIDDGRLADLIVGQRATALRSLDIAFDVIVGQHDGRTSHTVALAELVASRHLPVLTELDLDYLSSVEEGSPAPLLNDLREVAPLERLYVNLHHRPPLAVGMGGAWLPRHVGWSLRRLELAKCRLTVFMVDFMSELQALEGLVLSGVHVCAHATLCEASRRGGAEVAMACRAVERAVAALSHLQDLVISRLAIRSHEEDERPNGGEGGGGGDGDRDRGGGEEEVKTPMIDRPRLTITHGCLERLTFTGGHKPGHTALAGVQCPNLRYLRVPLDGFAASAATLVEIATTLSPRLETIVVSGHLPGDQLAAILLSCRRLRRLATYQGVKKDMESVSEPSVGASNEGHRAYALTRLEDLNLRDSDIGDERLSVIIRRSTQLWRLELNNCSALTTVSHLEGHAGLRQLHLCNLPRLVDTAFPVGMARLTLLDVNGWLGSTLHLHDLPQLRRLRLRDLTATGHLRLTDLPQLRTVMANSEQACLAKLDVVGCPQLTYLSMLNPSPSLTFSRMECPALRTFRLIDTPWLELSLLQAFCDLWPSLVELMVSSLQFSESQLLSVIQQRLLALTYLAFNYHTVPLSS